MFDSDWMDDEDDELSPDEYPDEDEYYEDEYYEDEYYEDEYYEDDSAVVVPCPECGAEIDEEAPQCPVCGSYITHDTSIWSGRPVWWILLGILGIVAVILAFVFA